MTALSFSSIARRRAAGEFRFSERLVVAIGACAFGLMLGAIAAVSFGRVYTPVATASMLILYGWAFLIAARSFGEILVARAWWGAILFGLHMLAFGLWPFAVMLYEPSSQEFWAGLASLLATLAAFLMLWRPPARIVYRICWQSALLTGVTAYQGVLMSIGS